MWSAPGPNTPPASPAGPGRFRGFLGPGAGTRAAPTPPSTRASALTLPRPAGKARGTGPGVLCFCSRAQLHAASAPHASDGELLYKGLPDLTPEQVAEKAAPAPRRCGCGCRRKPSPLRTSITAPPGPAPALWLRGLHPAAQRFGVYAHQLAVVADDGAMDVTQVVRGRDLLSTPPADPAVPAAGLSRAGVWPTPLLLASDGRRLSKRDGDQSLSGILSRGYSPGRGGGLAYLGGLLPEPAPAWPEELLPLFSWEKLPREDILLPEGMFGLG